jgi:deoxyinosine 3'endonuclease (endonuclease V)
MDKAWHIHDVLASRVMRVCGSMSPQSLREIGSRRQIRRTRSHARKLVANDAQDEVVGAALRTKNKVNPVYISVGSRMSLEIAIELTLRCDGGYRQPEPTRRAHLLVNKLRLENTE